jgi:NADH:ubiquinone oxidoreductase subunit 5 (subunit L)/multisubunit Na+/H+ antiporter MnhA subunit
MSVNQKSKLAGRVKINREFPEVTSLNPKVFRRIYVYALIFSVLAGFWCLFVFAFTQGAFSHLEIYGIKYGGEVEHEIRRTTESLLHMIFLPFSMLIVAMLIGWGCCLKRLNLENGSDNL